MTISGRPTAKDSSMPSTRRKRSKCLSINHGVSMISSDHITFDEWPPGIRELAVAKPVAVRSSLKRSQSIHAENRFRLMSCLSGVDHGVHLCLVDCDPALAQRKRGSALANCSQLLSTPFTAAWRLGWSSL